MIKKFLIRVKKQNTLERNTNCFYLESIYYSYRWMFKTQNFTDALIRNPTAETALLVYLFIFILRSFGYLGRKLYF